jgi:hypothetical protein
MGPVAVSKSGYAVLRIVEGRAQADMNCIFTTENSHSSAGFLSSGAGAMPVRAQICWMRQGGKRCGGLSAVRWDFRLIRSRYWFIKYAVNPSMESRCGHPWPQTVPLARLVFTSLLLRQRTPNRYRYLNKRISVFQRQLSLPPVARVPPPSIQDGKSVRAADRCAHRYARRNSRVAPVSGWPADRRCGSRRNRPAPS